MTDPRIDRIAARQHAQTAAARMTVTPLLDAETTTDDQVAQVVALFPTWTDKTAYKAGAIAARDGVLYRCVQAHTAQADWTPGKVPALWAPVRKTAGTEPDPWKQPAGAHDAYGKGDRVTFEGATWESTADANVWAPGVYGWVKV